MIKDTLQNIGGVGLYGIISICLFFAVFTGMLVWVLLLKKDYVNKMSGLPLEDGSQSYSPPPTDPSSQSPKNPQTDPAHE